MTNREWWVIMWHRLRLHESAFSMNGRSWLCQCGARVGEWSHT